VHGSFTRVRLLCQMCPVGGRHPCLLCLEEGVRSFDGCDAMLQVGRSRDLVPLSLGPRVYSASNRNEYQDLSAVKADNRTDYIENVGPSTSHKLICFHGI
jgi:hypothetical protein